MSELKQRWQDFRDTHAGSHPRDVRSPLTVWEAVCPETSVGEKMLRVAVWMGAAPAASPLLATVAPLIRRESAALGKAVAA